MNREEFAEQRIYTRFQAQEGAFAVPESHAGDPGELIDISMGGLAFRYVANGKRVEGSFDLDIFMINNVFYLEKLPVITVSDFYESANGIPFSVILMRRCSVQFDELTESKRSQLEYFVRNHAMRMV